MSTIWFDITNSPQVHFLSAIHDELKNFGNFSFLFTTREFAETTELLKNKVGTNFLIYGGHYGGNKTQKIRGLISRFATILSENLHYDISISCGSENAIWNSFIRRKKSIAFGDNDLVRQWTYGHFVDFAFFPDAISPEVLIRQGIKRKKLFLYSGYKEDVYLAHYLPDHSFMNLIPFDQYVLVRPENVLANYVKNKNIKSITPELLKALSDKGFNIIYLPRYEHDRKFAKGIKNVFIPDKAINGLDACYFSNAVLTGAGTLAREAACLGVPSFSFFAGLDLLAVDRKLIKEGKMFFSRNTTEIVNKVISSNKNLPDTNRSRNVKKEIMNKLRDVIQSSNS